MQIAIPHLYASVAQSLPFAASLTMRSFLCQRDQGNLLIYASTRLVAESADIVRHGGATRHDLNHGHEAEFIFEPLANPLMIHGDDRDALAATPAIIDKYLTGIAAAKGSTVVSVLVEKAEQAVKEAQDAQAKLAEAQSRLTSVNKRKASFEKVIVSLVHASGKVDELDTEDMRALLDLIGLRVTVSPDTGKLVEQERMTRGKRTVSYVRDHWSRMMAEYNLRGQEFIGCNFSMPMEQL
jgi:hypothetical protein